MSFSYLASFDSPAKINLFLEVYPKQNPQDHFHQLVSLFLALDFFDQIELQIKETIEKTDLIKIKLAPKSKFSVPIDRGNLIYQAVEEYLKKLRENSLFSSQFFQIEICLNKQIPVAAGLAGGSLNAASTLRYLNQAFQQALSRQELEQIASSLGSDVCFGLELGVALGLNRGELIKKIDLENSPIAKIKDYFFVLILPPAKEKLTARSVYQKFAESSLFKIPPRKDPHKIEKSLLKFENIFFNSLEKPALELSSWLRKTKEQIKDLGYRSLVSGSGPTLFAWFESEQAAFSFQKKLSSLQEQKLETKICKLTNKF